MVSGSSDSSKLPPRAASMTGRTGGTSPDARFRRRTVVEWCWLTVVVLALVVLAAAQQWTARADLAVYDIAIGAQAHPARDDILIVAIDDASITALGRWPWRRAVLAELVGRIAAGGPRVIGVDVILSEPDLRYPQDDDVLSRSFARAGNVVLPVVAEQTAAGAVVRRPLPGLGAAVGHINMTVDLDGVARQVYLLEGPASRAAQQDMPPVLPHFALAMAGFNGPPREPGSYRYEPAHGIDDSGWERRDRLRIPFAGPPGTFPRVSVHDVLAGNVEPSVFRGKSVFVGAVASGLGDVFPTPVSREGRGMSGVEILANTLQALRDGNAIVAVTAPWFWLGTLAPVLLAALAGLRLTPRGALAATALLLAGMFGASLLLTGVARLWFAPVAGMAGCLLFYPLWSWRRQEAALRFLSAELARLEQEPGMPAAPASSGRTLDGRMNAVYRMTSQLRNMRRFLSDGLESLPEATVICDVDGGVLLANRRSVSLAPAVLGRLAEADPGSGVARPDIRAVISQVFAVAAPGLAYWDALRASLESGLAAGPPPESEGVELTARDDRRFLLHGAPLHGEAGRLAGLIVSFIDITAVRLAERQREQTLRFLSHDMRSPQASILALIELQQSDAHALPERQLLSRIGAHANRTMALAEDFIRLARAESQYLALTEVDLVGLVLDATDELWALAKARGVDLQLDIVVDSAVMQGEPALLVRAIANLVSNAIKFSPPHQSVVVRLDRRGAHYVVAVRDHGPGIAVEDQARLFQPFSRLHGAGPDAPAGSGLGLVFVKTVAERHGGRVEVDSQAGEGATFTILLPAGASGQA